MTSASSFDAAKSTVTHQAANTAISATAVVAVSPLNSELHNAANYAYYSVHSGG